MRLTRCNIVVSDDDDDARVESFGRKLFRKKLPTCMHVFRMPFPGTGDLKSKKLAERLVRIELATLRVVC